MRHLSDHTTVLAPMIIKKSWMNSYNWNRYRRGRYRHICKNHESRTVMLEDAIPLGSLTKLVPTGGFEAVSGFADEICVPFV